MPHCCLTVRLKSIAHISAVLAALVAGCGSFDPRPGLIACGDDGECPRDLTCGADGLCGGGSGPGDDADPGDDDGGGPDGGSPCPGGPMSAFVDDFEDLDDWVVVGGALDSCVVMVDAGTLIVSTAEVGECGVRSAVTYAFVDQAAVMRVDDGNVNQGTPDLVFRATVSDRYVQLRWIDEGMVGQNCPTPDSCGTADITGGIRDYWSLRHDGDMAIQAGLSNTGSGFNEVGMTGVSSESATCVELFIGTTGGGTGDPAYPIWIDGVNLF
jgi:hypothetical protein